MLVGIPEMIVKLPRPITRRLAKMVHAKATGSLGQATACLKHANSLKRPGPASDARGGRRDRHVLSRPFRIDATCPSACPIGGCYDVQSAFVTALAKTAGDNRLAGNMTVGT